MTAKEKLVTELFNKLDTEKGTHRECLERIADFILADRARIVEPLVKHKAFSKTNGGVWLKGMTVCDAIDEAIKLSGV